MGGAELYLALGVLKRDIYLRRQNGREHDGIEKAKRLSKVGWRFTRSIILPAMYSDVSGFGCWILGVDVHSMDFLGGIWEIKMFSSIYRSCQPFSLPNTQDSIA